jgi:hypothetical protein
MHIALPLRLTSGVIKSMRKSPLGVFERLKPFTSGAHISSARMRFESFGTLSQADFVFKATGYPLWLQQSSHFRQGAPFYSGRTY